MRRRYFLFSAIQMLLVAGLVDGPSLQAETLRYQVTMDAVWSAATHPQDFPAGAHFSRLVGGTHNGGVYFWEPGGIASPGMEAMAERGATSTLSNEVNAAVNAGTAHGVVLGPSGFPSPFTQQFTFEVNDAFPLVSLVTMVAPSPDWFIGVSGLALHESNQWINQRSVAMIPWDAGTDSGTTFTSPNMDTQPREPIHRLDEKPGSPFFQAPPLGTMTWTRIPDFTGDGIAGELDVDLLVAEIAAGGTTLTYDLTGDAVVDVADLTEWRILAGAVNLSTRSPYPLGDANLDGITDGTDFGIWNTHKFTATAAWTAGDWNADGTVDGTDFGLWNSNKFSTASRTPQVPEPSVGCELLAVLAVWFSSLRKRWGDCPRERTRS